MVDDEPNESDPDPVPPIPGMAPEVDTFEGELDLAANILTMQDQWVSMVTKPNANDANESKLSPHCHRVRTPTLSGHRSCCRSLGKCSQRT